VNRLLPVLLAGIAAACAAAVAHAGGGDVYLAFRTPSQNIGCAYLLTNGSTRGSLRCDIGSGIRPAPSKPARCELDYGSGYSMYDTGRVYVVCAGDTVLRQGRVLGYGSIWRHGGFTCTSRSAGLRCTNRSKHGFFLSRAHSFAF
jgi:hypothetical protein